MVLIYLGQYRAIDPAGIEKFEKSIEDHGGWNLDKEGFPMGYRKLCPPIVLRTLSADECDPQIPGYQYEVLSGTHRVSAFEKKNIFKYPACYIISKDVPISHRHKIATEMNELSALSALHKSSTVRFKKLIQHTSFFNDTCKVAKEIFVFSYCQFSKKLFRELFSGCLVKHFYTSLMFSLFFKKIIDV